MIIKMTMRLDQFAGLTQFLCSQEVWVHAPKGKYIRDNEIRTSKAVEFARIKSAANVEGLMNVTLEVIPQFGIAETNESLLVGQEHLLALFRAIKLFPPDAEIGSFGQLG